MFFKLKNTTAQNKKNIKVILWQKKKNFTKHYKIFSSALKSKDKADLLIWCV